MGFIYSVIWIMIMGAIAFFLEKKIHPSLMYLLGFTCGFVASLLSLITF